MLGKREGVEKLHSQLRYVGVVWCVLQLLLIRFTQWSLWCIGKTTMSHRQKSDWNTNVCWFGYVYHGWMFVDFLNKCISVLPIVFIIECGVVKKIWTRSPISFKHVSFNGVGSLVLTNHKPIKYRGLIEISDPIIPANLIVGHARDMRKSHQVRYVAFMWGPPTPLSFWSLDWFKNCMCKLVVRNHKGSHFMFWKLELRCITYETTNWRTSLSLSDHIGPPSMG